MLKQDEKLHGPNITLNNVFILLYIYIYIWSVTFDGDRLQLSNFFFLEIISLGYYLLMSL